MVINLALEMSHKPTDHVPPPEPTDAKLTQQWGRSSGWKTAQRCVVTVTCFLATGCTHPIGFDVLSGGRVPTFGFHDNGRLWRSSVAAREIAVYRNEGKSEADRMCLAQFPAGTTTWRYGEASESGCQELTYGATYVLWASSPGRSGRLKFRITTEGKVLVESN